MVADRWSAQCGDAIRCCPASGRVLGAADRCVLLIAQAARLLRAALRRTEAELARLRAAQRENAQRRAAQGSAEGPHRPRPRRATRHRRRLAAHTRRRRARPTTPGSDRPPAAAAEPAERTRPPDTPTAAAETGGAADTTAPARPRRTGRAAVHAARGPALLRFDPDTVRLQRWPDHPGGWLVHALDPDGVAILIGHLTREDTLGGRTRGWQPLDEQRHRITGIGTLPKTRPDAVAAILRTHEQRHRAATRQHRLDKAVHPSDR